jgi:hypothetical protein
VKLITGRRQLTDLYLLGLARSKEGVLARFDRSIHAPGALRQHLQILD